MLPRMTRRRAPAARRGASDFTVPFVPTGMNTGVRIVAVRASVEDGPGAPPPRGPGGRLDDGREVRRSQDRASRRRTRRTGSARRSPRVDPARLVDPAERHHEGEQGRARQVEVREQRLDGAEPEAGGDEERGAPGERARAASVSRTRTAVVPMREHALGARAIGPRRRERRRSLAVDRVLVETARPRPDGTCRARCAAHADSSRAARQAQA